MRFQLAIFEQKNKTRVKISIKAQHVFLFVESTDNVAKIINFKFRQFYEKIIIRAILKIIRLLKRYQVSVQI
jgi:hypothetical protein